MSAKVNRRGPQRIIVLAEGKEVGVKLFDIGMMILGFPSSQYAELCPSRCGSLRAVSALTNIEV
jgi:hypothetical protein